MEPQDGGIDLAWADGRPGKPCKLASPFMPGNSLLDVRGIIHKNIVEARGEINDTM